MKSKLLLFTGGTLCVLSLGAMESLTIKAADFSRAHLFSYQKDAGNISARIKKTGNIAGYDKTKKENFSATGRLEYDFQLSEDGWYEISAGPDNISIANVEFTIDDTVYLYPTGSLMEVKMDGSRGVRNGNILGNFHLKKGKHTLRLEKRQWPHGLPRITELRIRESAPENRIRVTSLNPFGTEITAGKNETLKFSTIFSGLKRDSVLTAVLTDVKSEKKEETIGKIMLPATETLSEKTFSLSCAKEGIFNLSFYLDGKRLGWVSAPGHQIVVIDPVPVAEPGKELKKKLLFEIDCVKREPDFAKGKHRVVKNAAGAFRETSEKSGWGQHVQYSKNPEWIAWKFRVPEAGKLYLYEFDYPDDTKRATMFVVRAQKDGHYPKAVGVNSGGEFKISGKMQTASLLTWAPDPDQRAVVMSSAPGLRGAVSKIRVYAIDSLYPAPLKANEAGKRKYMYFYEEAPTMVGTMTTEDVKRASPETILTAMHRYCSQTGYFGVTEQFYTHSIYGGGLYPSKFRPDMWSLPFEKDFVRKFCMIAAKYGQTVVFDFHSALSDFGKTQKLYNPENRLLNSSGKENFWTLNNYLVNPIHPDTRKWRLAMIREFAERYKDQPNFKGIRLRNMAWQNSGWCSFVGLNWGYDDYTVGQFEKETGIKVYTPQKDERRFWERYRILTGPKYHEWIAWRTKKITELHVEVLNLLRSIRPDLRLYSNTSRDMKEIGIDPETLRRNGIIVAVDTMTGRPPNPPGRAEKDRLNSLKNMDSSMEPAGTDRAMMDSQFYYEGGTRIARPSELGYVIPKGKNDQVYYCASAWPAGRNELEYPATGLARRDTSIYIGGSISYGVGNPIMREFMNEFLRLPDAAFDTVLKDPVAVRQYKEYFYVVNSLPVPVKVQVKLKSRLFGKAFAKRVTDGSKFDVSNFELKPYQLMAFTTNSGIENASIVVPRDYVKTTEAQVRQLRKAAKQIPALTTLDRKVSEAFSKGEFCTVKLLLETNRPLMAENGLVIPTLREEGEQKIPSDAVTKTDLNVTTVDAKKLFSDWENGKFLIGKRIEFKPEIKFDGMFRLKAVCLGGDQYGSADVSADGTKIGTIENAGGKTYALKVHVKKNAVLRKGLRTIELRSNSEKPIGVLYLEPETVIHPVFPRYFRISKNFFMDGGHKILKAAMAKQEDAETNRDFNGDFWKQPVQDKDKNNHIVNLGNGKVGVTTYALTYVLSPNERTACISIGADYFWKIWINGKLVQDMADQGGGGAVADTARYLVKFKKGWNEIMIKIGAGTEANCMWFSVSNPGDLKFSANGPHPVSRKHMEMKGKQFLKLDFETRPVTGKSGKVYLQMEKLQWDNSGKEALSGKSALGLNKANTRGDFGILFPASAGKKYTFSVWLRPGSAETSGEICMDWKLKQGFGGAVKKQLFLSTDWQFASIDGVAPGQAEGGILSISGGSKDNVLWLDELSAWEE